MIVAGFHLHLYCDCAVCFAEPWHRCDLEVTDRGSYTPSVRLAKKLGWKVSVFRINKAVCPCKKCRASARQMKGNGEGVE